MNASEPSRTVTASDSPGPVSRDQAAQESDTAPPAATPVVARIPYLNAAPFYVHWDRLFEEDSPWRTRDLVPRHLGIAAEQGEVDAGLMAVADLLRLRETFEPLAVPARPEPRVFGIANKERVDSVLLFERTDTVESASGPPPLLHRSVSTGLDLTPEGATRLRDRTIAITGESSTSFRLLRLLLEVRFGVRPFRYTRLQIDQLPAPEHAAALVIGDQALRWRIRPPAGFHVAMDLATSWYEWTGAPFVFAVWGVRRTLAEDRKRWLGDFLAGALAAAQPNLADLAADLPATLGSPDELRTYLDNFIYELGTEERQASRRFESLLAEHRIDCTAD